MIGKSSEKSFLELIKTQLENCLSNYFGTDVDRTICEMRYTLLQFLSGCLSTLRNVLLCQENTLAKDFGMHKWNETYLLEAVTTNFHLIMMN